MKGQRVDIRCEFTRCKLKRLYFHTLLLIPLKCIINYMYNEIRMYSKGNPSEAKRVRENGCSTRFSCFISILECECPISVDKMIADSARFIFIKAARPFLGNSCKFIHA